MNNLVSIRVKGPAGLFAVPHLRAEPYSYDVITPSAAKGIFRAIFWKPEWEYEVVSVSVLNPILRYTSKYRSGPDLQTKTILIDLDYVITVRVIPNPYRTGMGRDRTFAQMMAFIRNRFRSGTAFAVPCFGQREYLVTDWEYIDETAETPTPIRVTKNLGSMLLDLAPLRMESVHDQWRPVFFRPKFEDGVLTVPESAYASWRDQLLRERHRVHPERPSEAGRSHASV